MKNYLLAICFIFIFSCSDAKEELYNGDPNIDGGKIVKVGFEDSIMTIDKTSFSKSINTKIGDFWIDGVYVITNNDTIRYENETKPVLNNKGELIHEPSIIVKGDDFQIEKPSKNAKKIAITIEENSENYSREFIFWFGTNMTYADKLIVIQK